jgi:hypothetical protein
MRGSKLGRVTSCTDRLFRAYPQVKFKSGRLHSKELKQCPSKSLPTYHSPHFIQHYMPSAVEIASLNKQKIN